MDGVVLVTGDRHATATVWFPVIYKAFKDIKAEHPAVEHWAIIHGGAKGIDSLAGLIARHDHRFVEHIFLPDWKQYGKKAGPIRNGQMVARLVEHKEQGAACFVLAFHNDLAGSKGTKDCVYQAAQAGFSPRLYLSEMCWEAVARVEV